MLSLTLKMLDPIDGFGVNLFLFSLISQTNSKSSKSGCLKFSDLICAKKLFSLPTMLSIFLLHCEFSLIFVNIKLVYLVILIEDTVESLIGSLKFLVSAASL
jgi:hypothetical protein